MARRVARTSRRAFFHLTAPVLLAACGLPSPSSIVVPFVQTTRTIRIIQPGPSGFGGGPARDLIARMTPDPSLRYNIVAPTLFSGPEAPPIADQYVEHVRVAAAEGGALIVLATPRLFSGLIAQGALFDLAPFASRERAIASDRFWPGAFRAGTSRGKLLALPLQLRLSAMLYRADRFESAQSAMPGITTTWQQLRELAPRIAPRGGQALLLAGFGPLLIDLAWHFGARVIRDDAAPIDLSERQTLDALRFIEALVRDGIALPPDEATFTASGFGAVQRHLTLTFGTDKAAVAFGQVSGASWWSRQGAGLGLSLAPLPRGPLSASLATPEWLVGVPIGAKDPDRSLAAMIAISDASRTAVIVPARRDDIDLLKIDPTMRPTDAAALLSIAEMARFVSPDVHDDFTAIIQREAVLPVLQGTRQPSQALSAAQDAINR